MGRRSIWNIFSDIVNLNISEETLDLNKAYTLLLISIFYRRHENLLSNSEYLRNLIQTDDIESKLIYVLKEEITLNSGMTNGETPQEMKRKEMTGENKKTPVTEGNM